MLYQKLTDTTITFPRQFFLSKQKLLQPLLDVYPWGNKNRANPTLTVYSTVQLTRRYPEFPTENSSFRQKLKHLLLKSMMTFAGKNHLGVKMIPSCKKKGPSWYPNGPRKKNPKICSAFLTYKSFCYKTSRYALKLSIILAFY